MPAVAIAGGALIALLLILMLALCRVSAMSDQRMLELEQRDRSGQ